MKNKKQKTRLIDIDHTTHTRVIIWRFPRGKFHPVPGLFCAECYCYIKWLRKTDVPILQSLGIEDLGLTPEDAVTYNRRLSYINDAKKNPPRS